MTGASSKKKQAHFKNDNLLEALGSVPSSVGSNTVAEFSKIGGDIVTALIGGIPKSGELRPNQEINFSHDQTFEKPTEQPRIEFRPAQPSVDTSRVEAETRQQIEAVRAELKALISSLKNLHQEVQSAVTEEVVNPGVYHINFYDQLRMFIRVLREQIEDSRTWLAASSSRKKKLGYWGMYKKHGTTFGLSSERTLATSAG